MFSRNLRIILSELTVVALLVQSLFGVFIETYAQDDQSSITPEITSTSPQESSSSVDSSGEPPSTNEILVQFKSDIDNSLGGYQVSQIESAHGLETTDIISENNIAVMKLQEDTGSTNVGIPLVQSTQEFTTQDTTTIDQKIEEIKQDPQVAHVQKNFIYELQSVNDPEYSKQWSLNNEGQAIPNYSASGDLIVSTPDADIDYPEAMEYASGKLGTGVIVAVLDTGIDYNHPDLKDNLWDGSNCVSETGAYLGGCKYGYDIADEDTDPFDDDTKYGFSHGTKVSGVISAGVNNSIGISGISNAKIMAVKTYGITNNHLQYTTTSMVISGINFAKWNGARIINASFGSISNSFDYLTYDAIKSFPGLFIAAAGNNSVEINSPKFFPAGFGFDNVVSGEIVPALSNVISVGSTSNDDKKSSFSNYGTNGVHIFAPGQSIYTTMTTVSSEWIDIGQYEEIGGTTNSNIFQVVSGENLIYTDIGVPYVSGESAYIKKTIHSLQGSKMARIKPSIICDVPTGFKDYVSIAYNSGSTDQVLTRIGDITEDSDYVVAAYPYGSGNMMRYNLDIPNIPINGDFDIKISWNTDHVDDVKSDGQYFKGCSIERGVEVIYSDFDTGNSYDYVSGTSFSAPHVAGAAALAWTYRPNATIEEVKSAILNGGDSKPQLAGLSQTGKRLNLLGMLKHLDHLDNPIPTSSHSSAVYRDPFTFTLSGEPSFYTVSGEDKIHYDIYHGSTFMAGGEVDASGVSVTVSGEDTTVRYYGMDNSGTTTPIQERKFYYDVIAPTLNQTVYNAVSGVGYDPITLISTSPQVEVKTATVAAPSSSRLYSSADQEIGRFAVTSRNEVARIQTVTFNASTTGTGVTVQSIANSTGSIVLYAVDTNTIVSAAATISGNTITFTSMNDTIATDTTNNYKVVLSVSSVENYYGGTIKLDSPIVTGILDSDNSSIGVTGSATTKTYTLGTVPPTVLVTAVNENVFKVRITNPDTNTGITLTSAKFDLKTALPGNTTYTATACLRDLGSSLSCGDGAGTSTATGAIPALVQPLAVAGLTTNMMADKNNGTVEFEVYVTSANLLPTGGQLQVALTELNYTVGGSSTSETYVGVPGNSATFMKDGGGGGGEITYYPNVSTGSTPTYVVNSSLTYFVTGSTANMAITAGDATLNFGGSGSDSIWNSLSGVLDNSSINSTTFGDVGIQADMYGTLPVTSGRRDYNYSLVDLMGNTTYANFSLYRLPDISNSNISHTGGVAKYMFTADMPTLVEYSYTQSGMTHTGTVQAMTGSNSITLTGVSLSGSVSGEVMIPKNLPDITIPDAVHHMIKQSAAYIFDPNPDTVAITKKLGVTPGSQVTFGPYILTGFNVPVNVSVNFGNLKVNGVSYGTGVASVKQGDSISIDITAKSSYSITYSGILSLGTALKIPYEIENALAPTPIAITGAGGGGGGGGGSSSSVSSNMLQGTYSSSFELIPIGIMTFFKTDYVSQGTHSTGNISSIQVGKNVKFTDISQLIFDNSKQLVGDNLVKAVEQYIFVPLYTEIQKIENANRQIITYNSLIRQTQNKIRQESDTDTRNKLRTLNKHLVAARQAVISQYK